MKLLVGLIAGILLGAAPVWPAPKSCEQLKSEIDAKMQGHKVVSYSLEIIDKNRYNIMGEEGGKVVAVCEGDKVIVLRKN